MSKRTKGDVAEPGASHGADAAEMVKTLASIVEAADDAIIAMALDGTISSWNPAARSMFGYAAAEIIGRPIDTLIPPDRIEEERAIQHAIRNGRHVRQLETALLKKDGARFPVSITASPVFAHDAASGTTDIVGISKIVRDITERRLAEAAAEAERRLVSGLLEAMPGIFYLYDKRGQFLRWNRNFERVGGYSTKEMMQLNPLDFFASSDRELVAQRIADVFGDGEATVEARFVAKDGSQTPYFFTGKRIVLDGTAHLVGVGIDIAERKRAEDAVAKSAERYRATLDAMMEGCQILDFDWRYLYLNPTAAIQNRRPNDELLGQRMPDMWPGIESTPVFALLRRCLEERVGGRTETEFVFPDGYAGWYDVTAQPVPEGVFILSMDITERRRAETALRELNASLEGKVAERTQALDAARERAESADRIKSAFLASMSHELRTPLNSILGFTGIVVKGMAGPLNPEQQKQLRMVQSSARHLLDLINDVLDISKIEAGQLEVQNAPFELRASIERAVGSVAPLADKKGLSLQVVVPEHLEPIESDRRRVEQILLNLLNNAIKFTDRGGVTLTADVGGTPRKATIRVADTGIGIAPEDLSLLFQPFRQIDTGLQRQHEGTGLGLAICRRLAGLLQGDIHAESVPGRGSVFTVVLPMKRTSAP